MKPLPDFPLLPHQLPPTCEEELVAPAHAAIQHENRDILLRVVKVGKMRYVVFLRENEQNYLLLSKPEVMIWREPPKRPKLERIARHLLKWRLFFRGNFMVVRADNGELRAAIIGSRYLSNIYHSTYSYSANWLKADLSLGISFVFEDNGDVLSSLQQAMRQPDSYASQMWQRQHWTPEERERYYEEARGKRVQSRPRNFIARLFQWKGF